MSLIDIIKLVGFATGAFLHIYISWLIWSRRRYGGAYLRFRSSNEDHPENSRKEGRVDESWSLTQSERTFVMLGLCLGAWFLGNLLKTLQELILGGSGRGTEWLRAWETITVLGVALFPSALLHCHIAFWSWLDKYRTITRGHVAIAGIACYVPMVFLPYTIYRINTGAYQDYFLKLRWFLLPYSVWQVITFWSSALIDWKMKDRLYAWAERERRFFARLSIMLLVIGAFQFMVVGLRRSGPTDFLWLPYILFSLLPTFTIAYYIYRYNLYELVIKGSLVYAAFAVVFITVYTYGVRSLDQFLVDRYKIKAGVVETILILGMVVLAGPVVRLIDKTVRRLFSREIGVYRAVVRQVSQGAAGFGELESLIQYTQEIIRTGLDLDRVRIVRSNGEAGEDPENTVAREIKRLQTNIIEDHRAVAEAGATVAYALNREERLIGLMLITADPRSLTSEKRAVLEVLAGQVAIEVESCLLVEEKVRLERELASRERLAALGQLAATIAHEVKNPLSSIKLITQVMREDSALNAYDRDLELIVGEIDRLNRTVSQLLSFSRPQDEQGTAPEIGVEEVIRSVVGLLTADANEHAVALTVDAVPDARLSASKTQALREALSNLILNAIQATPERGSVVVGCSIEERSKPWANDAESVNGFRISGRVPHHDEPFAEAVPHRWLILSVTDTGSGIGLSEQTRVFEPFFTTKPRGTGLGLAIVQRRTAEMGGIVELLSPVTNGGGTTFRVKLPIPPSKTDEQTQDRNH